MHKHASYVVVAMAFLALALHGKQAQAQSEEPVNTLEKNAEIFEKLNTKMVDLQYLETQFGHILDALTADHSIPFVLHESAFDNNLDEESVISLSLDSQRLSSALRMMLEPFDCTWTIDDGVVVVKSEDEALTTMNLMAFKVGDLTKVIDNVSGVLTQKSQKNVNGGFRGGGGVFSVQEVAKADSSQEDTQAEGSKTEQESPTNTPPTKVQSIDELRPEQQLAILITEMIDPDSWEHAGGNAKIFTINQVLVVRQTSKNFNEIHNLLEHLRLIGISQTK